MKKDKDNEIVVLTLKIPRWQRRKIKLLAVQKGYTTVKEYVLTALGKEVKRK